MEQALRASRPQHPLAETMSRDVSREAPALFSGFHGDRTPIGGPRNRPVREYRVKQNGLQSPVVGGPGRRR